MFKRNELIKSEWSLTAGGFWIEEVELLSVLLEVLNDGAILDGNIPDVVGDDDGGATAAQVIRDPGALVPFAAGVAD